MHSGIDNFAQVVRRNRGCHTNGNTLAAIHQKVGETRGQYLWFFGGAVVVGNHVDGVFVDAIKQAHR